MREMIVVAGGGVRQFVECYVMVWCILFSCVAIKKLRSVVVGMMCGGIDASDSS